MTREVTVPPGKSLHNALDDYALAVERLTASRLLMSLKAPRFGEDDTFEFMQAKVDLLRAEDTAAEAREVVMQAALRLARFASDIAQTP